jgi:septal ring factor EnvC (AmiA/AmiB activator)
MWLAEIVVSDGWLMLMAGVFVAQVLAAAAWAVRTNNAVDALKTQIKALAMQVTEGLKPVDTQRDRHEALDRRVVTLEEQGRTIFKALEKMDSKLDRLIEREG